MMLEKKAKTQVEINDLIASRWSVRSYNPEKSVSMEQIISICEAARWAPSCKGDEPWNFLVFNKKDDPESFQKAFDCINEWNSKWVKNVPVLMIVLPSKNFRGTDKANNWSQFDTGAACQNIYLQALSLGLRAHPFAGFDASKVMNDFSIPSDFAPIAMIAIGYQDEAEKIEEPYYKTEIAERKRHELGDNFFSASWGKPLI